MNIRMIFETIEKLVTAFGVLSITDRDASGNQLIGHGRFFKELRMLLMSTFLGSLAEDAFCAR